MRFFQYGYYTLACALMGAAYWQTNGLRRLWERDNTFGYMCEDGTSTCSAAEVYKEDAMRAAQTADMIGGAFTGVMLDLLGPKLTHCSGIFLLMVGTYLLSTKYVITAMILYGGPTQMVLNSILSVGVLFPKNQSAVVAIVCGACDISAIVFTLFNVIIEAYPTVTFSNLLFGYAVIQFICLVTAAIITPNRPFELVEKIEDAVADEETPLADKDAITREEGTWVRDLSTQLFDWRYLGYLTLFISIVLRMNIILVTNSVVLEHMGDDGSYARLMEYLLPVGFISSPFLGKFADVYGTVAGSAVLNLAGTIISALWMIPYLPLQGVQMVIFTLYKSCIYSMFFAFLADKFGFRFFGILAGFGGVVAGIVNQVIGKFISTWTEANGDHGYFYAHAGFTVSQKRSCVCIQT